MRWTSILSAEVRGAALACLGLAPLCAGLAADSAAPAPVPPSPRMKWADATRLGRPFSKDPSVIRFGGRYLRYFSLPPYSRELAPAGAAEGWSIGIAASRDLAAWEKIGEILPSQDCDRKGLCAPGAIVLDGRVHLFYQTYGNGRDDAICHAVSEDGVTFVRDPTNPVFRPSGSWTAGRAIDAEATVFIHLDDRVERGLAAVRLMPSWIAATNRRPGLSCCDS